MPFDMNVFDGLPLFPHVWTQQHSFGVMIAQ